MKTKILFWNLFACEGTHMIVWVGRIHKMTAQLTFENVSYVFICNMWYTVKWCVTAAKSAYNWVHYGVALVSMIDKIIGLFCKRALWKRQYSAKESNDASRLHGVGLCCSVCCGVCCSECCSAFLSCVFASLKKRRIRGGLFSYSYVCFFIVWLLFPWVACQTELGRLSAYGACVTWLICDLTHVWRLRLVGSIKLQVFFVEYRLFYRALWQKRPIV